MSGTHETIEFKTPITANISEIFGAVTSGHDAPTYSLVNVSDISVGGHKLKGIFRVAVPLQGGKPALEVGQEIKGQSFISPIAVTEDTPPALQIECKDPQQQGMYIAALSR